MRQLYMALILMFSLIGCGGGGSSYNTISTSFTNLGVFLDAPVEGIDYSSHSYSGITDNNGKFYYVTGETVTFKLGKVTLGKSIPNNSSSVVTPLELAQTTDINDSRVVEMLRVLQTLDNDNDPTNGIKIIQSKKDKLTTTINLSDNHVKLSDNELASLIGETTANLKTKIDAKNHFDNELKNKKDNYKTEIENENKNSHENDKSKDGTDHDGIDSDGDGSDTDSSSNVINTPGKSGYTLLAWNDLGMHCFDGSDFSVFSILPPFNNINAQLINNSATTNKHTSTGVTLSYKSLDYLGHTNTLSNTKTNFWNYLLKLFPSAMFPSFIHTSTPNIGLTGNKTPSTTAQNMSYNSTNKWFEATGIPIVNRDDDNTTNYYPMARISAKDTSGNILATADVVLPVSDEMNCAKCHNSNTRTDTISKAAKPTSGWVDNNDSGKDYKLNILRLHDQKYPNTVSDNNISLHNKGFDYNISGLEATANNGTPILCASCHSSNALPGTGIGSISSLTSALHKKHSAVTDPDTNLTLSNSLNRDSCYSCHPGAATECLRGAMGSAKNADGTQQMQCQSCHGTMNDVGKSSRAGWLDQPNCQSCHKNDGTRYTSSIEPTTGSLRATVNGTNDLFATNANAPSAGHSLYRYSTGHGSLQCSSCHGSTHAIFPSSHLQDNIISNQIQGHSGTVAECISCHETIPQTTSGGPHGMHDIGQNWVNRHGELVEHNTALQNNCTTCHSATPTGTVLSKTFSTRSFNGKNFPKGTQISCFSCHSGPNGGDGDGDDD